MELDKHLVLWSLDKRSIYAVAGWYIKPFKSIILTSDGPIYSELKPSEVMQLFCVLHGASYKGREEATRILSNFRFNKKVPVMIASPDVAAFPTCSPSHLDCVWIFNQPMSFVEISETRTLIVFGDGQKLEVSVSVSLLEKQCSRMYSVIGYLMKQK